MSLEESELSGVPPDDESLSTLAHDLKTPLAAIVGYAELLRARDDEQTRLEAATYILQAAERLSSALDSIAAVVAEDAGDLPQRLAAAVQRSRQAPAPGAGAHGAAIPAERASSRPRVVIADDDEALRGLVRTTLLGAGLQVSEAADGEQALRLVHDHVPDLVVLDWKMPGLHGSLVLDELKLRYPALPVIVLTAEVKPAQRDLAEALKADAYLTKPFRPQELIAAAERLLAERNTDQPP